MIGNKDQMHPEDMRNLMIFAALSLLLYFLFNHFILEPRNRALKETRQAQAEVQKIQRDNPQAFPETVIVERGEALKERARLPFDNGEIYGSIALKGGRIDDMAFHNYYKTLEKKDPVVLLSPANTEFPRFFDYGWLSAEKTTRVPDANTLWQVSGTAKLKPGQPVTLFWENGQGLRFERELALDENYLFTVTQRVVNRSGLEVTLYPYGLVTQTGLPRNMQGNWIVHEGPIGYVGGELLEIDYADLEKKPQQSREAASGWTGITDKYWLTGLIPSQAETVKYGYKYVPPKIHDSKGRYQVDFLGAPVKIRPGESASSRSHAYIGAKKVLTLELYEEALDIPHFDLAVDFGIYYFMTKPFFYILHWLGEQTGNMGIAIILLTLLIRSAVFPLTNTSYVSFAKMKKVSPQIIELREKYGQDKQKLQQAILELYQREGVNPMAGCLPILVQIPIFFALYKVLFVTIEMRHAPFFGWIQDLSAPDPTNIFTLFGLIPWDAPSFLHVGIWPCVMLVAMIFQKKLNPPPQDKLQRDMMNLFPFVITYMLSRFASGLVIYWAFSAIVGILQQTLIMKRLGVPIYLFEKDKFEEELAHQVEKGPGVHPGLEMVEDEVEDALFDHDEEGGEKPKKVTPPKPRKSKKKKK